MNETEPLESNLMERAGKWSRKEPEQLFLIGTQSLFRHLKYENKIKAIMIVNIIYYPDITQYATPGFSRESNLKNGFYNGILNKKALKRKWYL